MSPNTTPIAPTVRATRPAGGPGPCEPADEPCSPCGLACEPCGLVSPARCALLGSATILDLRGAAPFLLTGNHRPGSRPDDFFMFAPACAAGRARTRAGGAILGPL